MRLNTKNNFIEGDIKAVVAIDYICICFCILQIINHRTSEPLLLPADGGVDAHHRFAMCGQTAAAGSTFFCPRISAPFLRSYERPGGGSSSQDLSAK